MSTKPEMSRQDYMDLATACDVLEKYHRDQDDKAVTRFRGKRIEGKSVDIYLVSDPHLVELLRDATEEYVTK